MEFGLSEKVLETIKTVLAEFSEVEKASIFGSRANGNFKNGSDIDIAIYGRNVTAKTALEINTILNERKPLPYFFDIIPYSTLTNPDLKNQIDSGSVVFYKNQATQ